MIAVLLDLALMPACATVAGAFVWILYRNEALDDGALVRNFSFLLMLAAGTAFGTLRTDSVRMRIDPVFRVESEIKADPLYSTIARISSDDARELNDMLQQQMTAGATLSDAYLAVHPFLSNEVRRRTGWVDPSTRLDWARYVSDTFKKAHANKDYAFCHSLMTNQPLDRATLLKKFSPEEHQRFRDLAMRIYEASDLGMRDTNSSDKPVEFNDAAREFAVISADIEDRFGENIVQVLRRDKIESAPPSSFERLCAARIYQLEAMQKRPKAMASRLLDSVLR